MRLVAGICIGYIVGSLTTLATVSVTSHTKFAGFTICAIAVCGAAFAGYLIGTGP